MRSSIKQKNIKYKFKGFLILKCFSWSLTAIAVDKFMHIIDPTREQFSVRLAGFVTILIWLICSLVNVPYLMSFELVDGSYYLRGSNGTPFCGQVIL